MPMTKEKIGLIASNGILPLAFIEEATQKNISVIAIALTNEIANNIQKQKLAEKIHKIPLGQINKIIQTLKQEKADKVVLLGKVDKSVIFQGLLLDERARALIKKLINYQDMSFMRLSITELESDGLTVISQTEYLSSLLAKKGVLTKISPKEDELQDIQYGLSIASQMANLDIGQTIVVKNCTVIAVEALEGTDQTILRAGGLLKSGGIVVKTSRPNQDLRFDIPAVGLNTLKTMKKANIKTLAIEAQKTFVIEKEILIKFANENNMCIVVDEVKLNNHR